MCGTDSSLVTTSNAILHIGISNAISEIETDTCIPSNNNSDDKQCDKNQKTDFNLKFCDNTREKDDTKLSTHLSKNYLSFDEIRKTLVDSGNNVTNGKSTIHMFKSILYYQILFPYSFITNCQFQYYF